MQVRHALEQHQQVALDVSLCEGVGVLFDNLSEIRATVLKD
jgi:hypothetical protein